MACRAWFGPLPLGDRVEAVRTRSAASSSSDCSDSVDAIVSAGVAASATSIGSSLHVSADRNARLDVTCMKSCNRRPMFAEKLKTPAPQDLSRDRCVRCSSGRRSDTDGSARLLSSELMRMRLRIVMAGVESREAAAPMREAQHRLAHLAPLRIVDFVRIARIGVK